MENQYAWADADAMVDFCYKNNIRFRGHCLVWHEALPTWVWDIYNSGDYVRLKQVLMDHITTVVTRYKGKIQEWDVLNEIFSDDDPSNNTYGLRDAGDAENNPSIWYRAFGPSIYIDAIKKVKEIDPACEVWINDYGIEQLGMRYKLANMASFINYAIAAGAQIDGVGFQAHNYDPVGDPSTASDTLNSMQYIVAQTGLKVRISELDVDGASTRSTLFSDKLDVCTNFIENPNCRSLGIWGFTDKYSSMSGPTNNGTSGTNYTSPNWGVNYADGLIFNTNYAKKSAYDAMLSILELKR